MDTIQMDQNQLNDALYDKMDKEQQEYRAWLTAQPPDEILDHAAEFTIREDILVEMEVVELPTEQAAAWLRPPRWRICTGSGVRWRPTTWRTSGT